MSNFYDSLSTRNKGAWVVHHGQKTSVTINGAAEFPALDVAGKAASLLSQLAASEQITIEPSRVEALARAVGLNPKLELPFLLDMLVRRRVIDRSSGGGVEVLGLTSRATVQHAGDIFEDQEPTAEERATIALAEIASEAPQPYAITREFLADEFKLATPQLQDLLARAETIGFVDAEGRDTDKVYFNGNLFRRNNIDKVKKVLNSLSSADQAKAAELDALLAKKGCVTVAEAERVLEVKLFEKLRAAGMYDVNLVANSMGEFGFVTRPSAFHKFNDPIVDDAFDLAKALVAALTYGMTQSSASRGQISMISALLRKLINGHAVGPATAIGEDYKVLEYKGVIQVSPVGYGFKMRLLKKDIGEMALAVLTTGDASAANASGRLLPGQMTGFSGPEKSRWDLRQKQEPASKRMTQDVLNALRTGGAV